MTSLDMLLDAFPEAISGETIAQALSLSRAGVWKQMQSLQKQGLKIEGKQNSGYRLLEWPDQLRPEIIKRYLESELGRHVIWQERLESTNDTAKEIARQNAPHGTLVTTEEQTAGRGRRGRHWASQRGDGIYASLILRPQLPTRRVPLLTLAAGVALVRALIDQGLTEAWLKWPNDIWVGRRKLAGILSELAGEMDMVDYAIIGMGINMHHTVFPNGLGLTATSFYQETGRKINRSQLLAQTLKELEEVLPLVAQPDASSLLAAWQEHDRLLGQEVMVATASGSFCGQVLGLTPSGALRVAIADGTERIVLAGDVSIRPVAKV